MNLAPDFDDFIGCLTAHGVEFLIVGAYALALHGVPRFTGDLDIFVQPSEANGRKLLDAVTAFGFPIAELTPADIAAGTKLVEMGLEPVQIHVMSSISGVEWAEAWDGRAFVQFGTRRVNIIGRAAFVKNKRAAGRFKDLADVEALGDG